MLLNYNDKDKQLCIENMMCLLSFQTGYFRNYLDTLLNVMYIQYVYVKVYCNH